MKLKNWLILGMFLSLFACKKTAIAPADEGTVFTKDLALCACCGGFFIKINNDTMRFYKFPDGTGISDTTPLPYRIRLDWQRDTVGCGKVMRNLISITRAERL